MNERELLEGLEKCGHFLHHRRGGKRGQERILHILDNGQISQKELQNILEIQAGSLSEILMKMEEKNLIIREKDETDRRRSSIAISEKGREQIRGSREKKRIEENLLFLSLSEEEQEELLRLLNKLLQNWETDFGEYLSRQEKHGKRGRCVGEKDFKRERERKRNGR